MTVPLRHPPPGLTRRQWMTWGLAGLASSAGLTHTDAPALPLRTLRFPRDHGSHPDLNTEWWYITGHARAGGQRWGFQLTFFRSRVEETQQMRSAFAAKQLLFAHAAITDVAAGRLLHDQRLAREGFGIARASTEDTDIRLLDWSLVRTPGQQPGTSRYAANIRAREFALELECDSTQPLLLQGQQGLSRKGPESQQASYYYSQPQLAVRGALTVGSRRMSIQAADPTVSQRPMARAWMDHEWSDALLHPEAVGWDWIGMNLHDASALTVFRLRRADGSGLWAGGSIRRPGQPVRSFASHEVTWKPLRWWVSPHSATRYPVQWQIATPAGNFTIHAEVDDQELDSSTSTGAVYWEGLSTLHTMQDEVIGQGYLEMTGYHRPLRL